MRFVLVVSSLTIRRGAPPDFVTDLTSNDVMASPSASFIPHLPKIGMVIRTVIDSKECNLTFHSVPLIEPTPTMLWPSFRRAQAPGVVRLLACGASPNPRRNSNAVITLYNSCNMI
jgi:hypothetical protein